MFSYDEYQVMTLKCAHCGKNPRACPNDERPAWQGTPINHSVTTLKAVECVMAAWRAGRVGGLTAAVGRLAAE